MPPDTLAPEVIAETSIVSPLEGVPCFARIASDHVYLGNELYSEVWAIGPGIIQRISFQIGEGDDWFERPNIKVFRGEWSVAFSTSVESFPLHEGEPLVARLILRHGDIVRTFTWRIFERLPGSILHTSCEDDMDDITEQSEVIADGIEEPREDKTVSHLIPYLGLSVLARPHLTVTEVQFVEQSDIHSEFVFGKTRQLHPSERDIRLQTNFVYWEDPSSGEGIVFILLAPSRLVRAHWSLPFDFRMTFSREDGRREFHWEVHPGRYPLASIGYTGGEFGRVRATTLLQRVLHTFDPNRDGLLLSNTWGDRSRANRLNAEFISREIKAAAALGVEIVQIDDGWQQGRSANTSTGGVWNGFWETDENFWNVDKQRFPHGLAPLQAQAHSLGLSLGLWYAPDSFGELKNWLRDAEQILSLWRAHDIRHFKLDAIKTTSKLAEQRLAHLLQYLQAASQGQILIDLDATAETRPTYWGHISGAVIFLQNRYTDTGTYYPHQTLRALWSLASYILPSRIRAEFLNPCRNQEIYGDDPLRPSAYPVETLFAIAMTSSPLAWLESSGLSSLTLNAWRPLILIWKSHRLSWSKGTVLPIGKQPDGCNWTGFISIAEDALSGYALVFRELNTSQQWTLELPHFKSHSLKCRHLAGRGEAQHRRGRLHLTIPSPLQFLFIRLESDLLANTAKLKYPNSMKASETSNST